MISGILRKIYANIGVKTINNPKNVSMSIDEQMRFLNEFPDPKDDYERSFYKYKCLCKYCYEKRRWLLALYNIGAGILLPFVTYKLKKNIKKCKSENHYDAIIENVPRLPNDDIIPDEIKHFYDSSLEVNTINYMEGVISGEAITICKVLRKRYFWKPYFRLICLFKLGFFNKYIIENTPDAIVFYSYESEFSGPLQTLLCERNSVKFISYMHGEYMYQLYFAFQKYSKYYIWEDSYIDFFKLLRCDFPIEIYTPIKLSGIARAIDAHRCKYFATYYFSNESIHEAEAIHDVFSRWSDLGLRCKIRPHPRYSNIEMLSNVFSDIEIEDVKAVTLSDSLTYTLNIIGLNTTVLSQAFYSGKNVIVDDISNMLLYEDMKKKRFPPLFRDHIVLSEKIKEVESIIKYDKTFDFYVDRENS